jgi:hypothetical protein
MGRTKQTARKDTGALAPSRQQLKTKTNRGVVQKPARPEPRGPKGPSGRVTSFLFSEDGTEAFVYGYINPSCDLEVSGTPMRFTKLAPGGYEVQHTFKVDGSKTLLENNTELRMRFNADATKIEQTLMELNNIRWEDRVVFKFHPALRQLDMMKPKQYGVLHDVPSTILASVTRDRSADASEEMYDLLECVELVLALKAIVVVSLSSSSAAAAASLAPSAAAAASEAPESEVNLAQHKQAKRAHANDGADKNVDDEDADETGHKDKRARMH